MSSNENKKNIFDFQIPPHDSDNRRSEGGKKSGWQDGLDLGGELLDDDPLRSTERELGAAADNLGRLEDRAE